MPPNIDKRYHLPPATLQPVGISFDTEVPAQQELLEHSLLPVDEDHTGPYAYDVMDPATTPSHDEMMMRVAEAMSRVHPQYRTAIGLRFGLGDGDPLYLAETAEALGVSQGTAALWLEQGLRDLRRELGVPEPPRPEKPRPVQDESRPDPVPVMAVQPARARTLADTLPPKELAAPAALFAHDVGSAVPRIDFDAERYAAALRGRGVSEERIAAIKVLFFSSTSVANRIITNQRIMGQRLGPLRHDAKAGTWKGFDVVAIKADHHANTRLADQTVRHLLAPGGGADHSANSDDWTPREIVSVTGCAVAVCALGGEIPQFLFQGPPSLAWGLGAAVLAGSMTWGVAESKVDRPTIEAWLMRQRYGPFVTVEKNSKR